MSSVPQLRDSPQSPQQRPLPDIHTHAESCLSGCPRHRFSQDDPEAPASPATALLCPLPASPLPVPTTCFLPEPTALTPAATGRAHAWFSAVWSPPPGMAGSGRGLRAPTDRTHARTHTDAVSRERHRQGSPRSLPRLCGATPWAAYRPLTPSSLLQTTLAFLHCRRPHSPAPRGHLSDARPRLRWEWSLARGTCSVMDANEYR